MIQFVLDNDICYLKFEIDGVWYDVLIEDARAILSQLTAINEQTNSKVALTIETLSSPRFRSLQIGFDKALDLKKCLADVLGDFDE